MTDRSNVVAFAAPEPSLEARLAARRAYRQRCQAVAAQAMATAFTSSAKGIDIGVDDALPLFLAAMRRELRKNGCP